MTMTTVSTTHTQNVELPQGWTTSRVKHLGRYINGYAFKPDDWGIEGIPILRIQNLSDRNAEYNRFAGELPDDYLVRHDDILISWSASLAVHKWQGEDAWLNQHIFKVEVANNIVRQDYFYWLACWFIEVLADRAHGSTMQHLTRDAFGSLDVPLPPLLQQGVIAAYLDQHIARLDELIASKQYLLDLLAEKRQALITHAVTRGLDPATPLRDSGVPWLGEIPAHWETEYARWLFTEIDQRSQAGEEELLTVSHLTGVTSRAEKDVNMFMAESLEGYKVCQPGDLVINTLWAWMGAMGVAFQHGIVSPAYNVYRPEGYHPRYLDLLARIPLFATEVTRYSKGVWSSRLRLYPDEFFQVQMPVPPMDEQRAIAEYLEQEVTRIDELTRAAEKTIGLLQERRTSLIAAAVTGQIGATS